MAEYKAWSDLAITAAEVANQINRFTASYTSAFPVVSTTTNMISYPTTTSGVYYATGALADDAKDRHIAELEAKIAELEALVANLKSAAR